MQTVSLGFEELKGLGFFHNEFRYRLTRSCRATSAMIVKLTENGVLCVFLAVVCRYVLPTLLVFIFLASKSHLAFTMLLFHL